MLEPVIVREPLSTLQLEEHTAEGHFTACRTTRVDSGDSRTIDAETTHNVDHIVEESCPA